MTTLQKIAQLAKQQQFSFAIVPPSLPEAMFQIVLRQGNRTRRIDVSDFSDKLILDLIHDFIKYLNGIY